MGSVYVLIPPASNLVKIGFVEGETAQAIEQRMKALSRASGVPGRYKCAGAWTFANARNVERALHDAFADHHYEKEFFDIEPTRVIAILKQFGRKNVTPGRARRKKQPTQPVQGKRRPPLKFSMVGIEPGAILTSKWDPSARCQVIEDGRVDFEGTPMSLTAAAVIVNKRRGKDWSSVGGPDSWMYGEPPVLLSKLSRVT